MTAPIFIDLTHTSHTRARTGVQRVARALLQDLGSAVQPICHDPFLRAWRPLEGWEMANLAAAAPAAGRAARWPFRARIRGLLRRLLRARRRGPAFPGHGSLLVPEIFSPAVAAALPGLFGAVDGPRAALFHDAVALTHPELAPPRTVARAPAYLQELADFDGIAAVSEASRDKLIGYWRWLGLHDPPPIAAIPLGIDPPAQPAPQPERILPVVLSVGSIEGRKNHLALIEACERLWSRGMRFELRLIGLARPQTGDPALRRIGELQRAGRPLVHLGAANDAAREDAYAACAFTVYPSLAEGFGLPVAESLARGRPCVCLGRGGPGEIARGGGCLTVDPADADTLSTAIGRLLSAPGELAGLAAAAGARPIRTWSAYGRDLAAWLHGLQRRRSGPPRGP
jgi:glycosyltransferase involved in cell wall biosynthesis